MTPEGWKDLSLADIANVVGGVGFPRAHQGTQTGEFPFFKVSDMNAPGNARELRVAANTVDETLLESLKGTLHPPGTVVFPKVGAALLTNKRRKLVVPSCFDNNVMGLVATGCDPDFLYLLMQTVDFAKHVQPGAVPSVNGSMVGSIRALVPPVPEQRKIAAILSAVDDAIEKTQAVIDQVRIVKRGLMQELLTRGLPGRHTRFKQTDIGEIPEEWPLSSLPEVVYFQEGPGLRKWLFRDHGMPFINIRCIRNDGTLDLSKVQYIAKNKAQESYQHFFLEPDDTVLSSSGTLGRMAVVGDADLPLMLNTSVIRFRTLDEGTCTTSFMRAFLSSKLFLSQVLRESQGSAQANFGPTHLGKVQMPLPSVVEQKAVSAAFTVSSKRLMVEATKRSCLLNLKSALMSVLLTGKVRVTPDPEPA